MRYKPAAPHACGARRRLRGGFTLLEMLTVIIIIGLLLSIGTPSVLRMQTIAQRSNSLRTIHLIEGACRSYRKDFYQFPPSNPSENEESAEGRHNLVQALVGYRDDDGKTGIGFKVRDGGKVWGPYGGCEDVDISGAPYIFLDSFGNEIFYYRWDSDTGGYNDDDNTDGPPDIDLYAKDPDGKYFRKDFLLITKGPDGGWLAFSSEDPDGSTTDDITNFLRED